MAKWEYLIGKISFDKLKANETIMMPAESLGEFLNRLGADGWELVAVVGPYEHLYFKRRCD